MGIEQPHTIWPEGRKILKSRYWTLTLSLTFYCRELRYRHSSNIVLNVPLVPALFLPPSSPLPCWTLLGLTIPMTSVSISTIASAYSSTPLESGWHTKGPMTNTYLQLDKIEYVQAKSDFNLGKLETFWILCGRQTFERDHRSMYSTPKITECR